MKVNSRFREDKSVLGSGSLESTKRLERTCIAASTLLAATCVCILQHGANTHTLTYLLPTVLGGVRACTFAGWLHNFKQHNLALVFWFSGFPPRKTRTHKRATTSRAIVPLPVVRCGASDFFCLLLHAQCPFAKSANSCQTNQLE